ncbi:hypothetical protein D3C72_1919200 [compost metagenome]
MPGVRPAATTASLPSAVAICTTCDLMVLLAASYTQTAVDWPSWRRALVGSLMAAMPAWLSALGVTYTVEPSAGASAPSMDTLIWNVRVAASALAATSRTRPVRLAPPDQPRTATSEPCVICATLSSGTANTTSRGPSWAMRTTGVPADTTWPGSASIPVTTPDTSATSVV